MMNNLYLGRIVNQSCADCKCFQNRTAALHLMVYVYIRTFRTKTGCYVQRHLTAAVSLRTASAIMKLRLFSVIAPPPPALYSQSVCIPQICHFGP